MAGTVDGFDYRIGITGEIFLVVRTSSHLSDGEKKRVYKQVLLQAVPEHLRRTCVVEIRFEEGDTDLHSEVSAGAVWYNEGDLRMQLDPRSDQGTFYAENLSERDGTFRRARYYAIRRIRKLPDGRPKGSDLPHSTAQHARTRKKLDEKYQIEPDRGAEKPMLDPFSSKQRSPF